ncbi:MAG: biopolymer transporter ExbD [Polyangiaceae bacterium]|nr:biopolymer transporter ExbD [Polyangiaceae bacterium]MCB9605128.1 biopolymer transporter ExbD [Polyangiaceae bacterium]
MAAPGQTDAPLTAAQRGKIRRLSQPAELSPDEEGGELNIVPFLDIVVNILIFVLATVAVTFTATIDTAPPASGGTGTRSQVTEKSLNLTVFIVNDGFSIKASGGSVAPGCSGLGSGITIPLRGGRYDYDALTACAKKLKDSSPDFKEENNVYLAPNPGTDYQTIVSVMDSLRNTAAGDPLFTDVNFKVSK